MSRQKTDLRPSVVKMTITKNPLPNISSTKDRVVKPDLAPAHSPNMVAHKPREKADNTEQLLKEIEKWRHKFTLSQKSLDESRADVKCKEDNINSLSQKITSLTADHKKDLQLAKEKYGNHSECKKEANNLKVMLDAKEKQIADMTIYNEEMKQDFEVRIESARAIKQEELEKAEQIHKEEKEKVTLEMTTQISKLKEVHEKELASKDEKLKMLKRQIAEVLTGSSAERQKQIEELLKELKRVSEEAETVKAALRNLKGNGDCQNCEIFKKKCKELQEEVNAKNVIFNDLLKVSSKMDKQLSQHDDLLGIFNKLKKDSDSRRANSKQ